MEEWNKGYWIGISVSVLIIALVFLVMYVSYENSPYTLAQDYCEEKGFTTHKYGEYCINCRENIIGKMECDNPYLTGFKIPIKK